MRPRNKPRLLPSGGAAIATLVAFAMLACGDRPPGFEPDETPTVRVLGEDAAPWPELNPTVRVTKQAAAYDSDEDAGNGVDGVCLTGSSSVEYICYSVEVTCEGLTHNIETRFRVPDPAKPGSSRGAVWFNQGGNNMGFYGGGSADLSRENHFHTQQVLDVVDAGFTSVESRWTDPHSGRYADPAAGLDTCDANPSKSPGEVGCFSEAVAYADGGIYGGVDQNGDFFGIQDAAATGANAGGYATLFCAYHDLISWAVANGFVGGGTEGDAPLGLVGSSGGSGQVGAALIRGLDTEVDSAVMISGPPFARVDISCVGASSPLPEPLGVDRCPGGLCDQHTCFVDPRNDSQEKKERCFANMAIGSQLAHDMVMGYDQTELPGYTPGHSCVAADSSDFDYWQRNDQHSSIVSTTNAAAYDYEHPSTALHFVWSERDHGGMVGTYYARWLAAYGNQVDSRMLTDNSCTQSINEDRYHQIYQHVDTYDFVVTSILQDLAPPGVQILHPVTEFVGSGCSTRPCTAGRFSEAIAGSICDDGGSLEKVDFAWGDATSFQLTIKLRSLRDPAGLPTQACGGVSLVAGGEVVGKPFVSCESFEFDSVTQTLVVPANAVGLRLEAGGMAGENSVVVEHIVIEES